MYKCRFFKNVSGWMWLLWRAVLCFHSTIFSGVCCPLVAVRSVSKHSVTFSLIRFLFTSAENKTWSLFIADLHFSGLTQNQSQAPSAILSAGPDYIHGHSSSSLFRVIQCYVRTVCRLQLCLFHTGLVSIFCAPCFRCEVVFKEKL